LATASTDPVAVQTAARVLLNTIENAVTQAQGPSPEKLAIIELIDERISASQANVYTWIDMWAKDNLRDKVMDMLSMDDVDDQISNWMSNNFDITDYNVDDAIDSWMENNMDDKIQDAINNLTFSVTVS
jgi:uncharacterized membrane protein YheB (UPF0754 family)